MSVGMNIAFFGSSLVSAKWNGAATYYRGIVRALHGRGHQVVFYEPDAYGRQEHRDISDPEWARVVVFPPNVTGAQWALDQASEADLIIKASGVGAEDSFLEAGVLQVRRPGATVIFWDVDAPATLERAFSDPDDPFRALVPHYDLVFTYGGGQPVVDAYRRLGARTCVPIYNAVDPDTHHPVRPQPRFAFDLSFLGNRLPDREERMDEFFFAVAEALPDLRFGLGGSGWESRPLPDNVIHVGHVYTRDHNAFNCSPRAVLNVNRASMARYGFSPPTRVFEAAGAAACLICDRWEGMGEFLEPGEEVLVAGDGDEVAARLASLTPVRARQIGDAARRRVLAQHTYAHRARQLDDLLTGRGAGAA